METDRLTNDTILNPDRLNLDFSQGTVPFKEECMEKVPVQLAERLTEQEWQKCIADLKKVNEISGVGSKSCSEAAFFSCYVASFIVLAASVVGIPLIFVLTCWKRDKYQKALRKWQDDFNQEVLQPKGMHCKTQSICGMYESIDGDGNKCMVWGCDGSRIAFALSATEVKTLKNEPHLLGQESYPDRPIGKDYTNFVKNEYVIWPDDSLLPKRPRLSQRKQREILRMFRK